MTTIHSAHCEDLPADGRTVSALLVVERSLPAARWACALTGGRKAAVPCRAVRHYQPVHRSLQSGLAASAALCFLPLIQRAAHSPSAPATAYTAALVERSLLRCFCLALCPFMPLDPKSRTPCRANSALQQPSYTAALVERSLPAASALLVLLALDPKSRTPAGQARHLQRPRTRQVAEKASRQARTYKDRTRPRHCSQRTCSPGHNAASLALSTSPTAASSLLAFEQQGHASLPGRYPGVPGTANRRCGGVTQPGAGARRRDASAPVRRVGAAASRSCGSSSNSLPRSAGKSRRLAPTDHIPVRRQARRASGLPQQVEVIAEAAELMALPAQDRARVDLSQQHLLAQALQLVESGRRHLQLPGETAQRGPEQCLAQIQQRADAQPSFAPVGVRFKHRLSAGLKLVAGRGRMPSQSGQALGQRRKAVVEQGPDALPQERSIVAQIVVGRIFDPAQTQRFGGKAATADRRGSATVAPASHDRRPAAHAWPPGHRRRCRAACAAAGFQPDLAVVRQQQDSIGAQHL